MQKSAYEEAVTMDLQIKKAEDLEDWERKKSWHLQDGWVPWTEEMWVRTQGTTMKL